MPLSTCQKAMDRKAMGIDPGDGKGKKKQEVIPGMKALRQKRAQLAS